MTLRLGHYLSLIAIAASMVAVPARARAADDAKADVAVGYSYMHDTTLDTNFPAGWFAAVGVNIGALGVVAEADGAYKTVSQTVGTTTADASFKVHTFMAGPRVMAQSGQFAVYGQFLLGVANGKLGFSASSPGGSINVNPSSETDFAYEPGVGVDIGLTPNVGIRVGANFRFIKGDGDTAKEQQIIAGVVYKFGK